MPFREKVKYADDTTATIYGTETVTKSIKKSDNVYTITVTPLESFNNKVTIMSYFRINNNNSVVKTHISASVTNYDGSVTSDFTVPQSN